MKGRHAAGLVHEGLGFAQGRTQDVCVRAGWCCVGRSGTNNDNNTTTNRALCVLLVLISHSA